MKHSKYKNTGILFELLTRQITEEAMSNSKSKAIGILKKHFNSNSYLLKEYQIYYTLLNKKFDKESSANVLMNTLLESYNTLNKPILKREKYNLVRDIKENYNVDNFFKSKIDNYKILASIYTLLEGNTSNPTQLAESKVLVLETLTKTPNSSIKDSNIKSQYLKEDKETQQLAYKLLLEKFNSKYSSLSSKQIDLLKEYVYSITNSPKLKEYVNKEIKHVHAELLNLENKVDEVTKIKIQEVKSLIKPLCKKSSIHDDNVVNLLNYYELIDEIKKTL